MKNTLFTSIILITLIFTSCKKNDTPNVAETPIPLKFDTTTVILSESKIQSIKQVYPTYMIVTGINLGATRGTGTISALNLQQGGLFFSAPNSKFPQGSFEKIQNITLQPNGDFRVNFATFDPLNPSFSICDALQSGSHLEQFPVTNKIEKVTDELGNVIPVSFDGGKLKIEISKSWDWDGDPATDDKVELSGVVKTNLDLDVDLRVQNWKVEKFKTELKLKYEGELKAKANLPLLDEKQTWKIYTIYLQPVTVLVGGVFPIVMNPVVNINANVSAKGDVFLEGTLIKYANDFSKGLEYTQSNGFRVIGTESFEPLKSAISPELKAEFEGEFKVSPEMALEIRMYNKEGISVSAGFGLFGKLKITAEASTSNPDLLDLNAEIKLGMEGKLKGKLKIFNKEIADKELTYTIAEISLWDQKKFRQGWNTTNSGLLAYYPFNGNVNDESGNNNNGNIQNSPKFEAGVNAQGVSLTGRCEFGWCEGALGDHILIPVLPINNLSSFSINIWVKEETLLWPDGESYISFGSDQGNIVSIGHYGNNLRFSSSNRSILDIPFATSNLKTYQMYTLVFDKGTLKGYQNGKMVGTLANAELATSGTYAAIGRHWGISTYTRFTGGIDQVRIYRRALTGSEITSLFVNKQ